MKSISLTADQIYKLSKAGFCPQIKSVDGFTEIIDSYKKIGIGFLFSFQNGKELKVAINHKMFISGNWVEAKDLHIGDFINETDYVLSKIEVPSQEWIDFSVRDKSESYYHKDILHHNSGKSAILYYKIRWHIAQGNNILLIVPTTQLVSQMVGDFIDYSAGNGFDVGEHCQMLFAGKDKEFTKQVMIQTWQSLAAMAKSQKHLFQLIVDRTDVVCMDEQHVFKSDVTSMVVNKLVNTKWRTGTTGTMQEAKVNKLQLIGMMSEPYDVITTKELMDQNSIVKLDIRMLVIKYPEYIRREMNGMDYKQEIDYLVTNAARNHMIAEIAKNCKGTTLILFNFVHKHGAVLYEIVQKIIPSTRKVVFIHGGVDVNDREAVRLLADTEEDIIIVASSSIFSTGTNIPSIENVIFAMPTKSTIRVRQSIGRGLRLRNGKSKCTLFDISDDLSYKSYTNTTLNHMHDRVGIYKKEQFDFKITNIPLVEVKSTVLTDLAIDDGPPW